MAQSPGVGSSAAKFGTTTEKPPSAVTTAYASSVDETITKLEYDLYYIKHRSLVMDLTIMLRTVSNVVRLRGM